MAAVSPRRRGRTGWARWSARYAYAPPSALGRLSRGAAETQRTLASAPLMALFGWPLGLIFGADAVLPTALAAGGLVGVRPLKLAFGLLVGLVLGALLEGTRRRPRQDGAVCVAALSGLPEKSGRRLRICVGCRGGPGRATYGGRRP